MLALSLVYKFNISRKIMKFLFPTVIMGPVISLIGLELASIGASDSGFNEIAGIIDMKISLIALFTLFVIILASVIRRSFLKNSSIVIGVIIGYILSVYFLKLDLSPIKKIPIIQFPKISSPWVGIPPNLFQLFIAVLPATIVIFMENISRITVVKRLKLSNDENEQPTEIFNDENNKDFNVSLLGHAASIFLSANTGSVPTTIYAENIAVMSINNNDATTKHKSFNPFSFLPYVFAAVLSIFVSFLGWLQYILMNIPKPVIGGVELFLFGIITAPGIQMLVEQKVNYKKVSNQILTAAVLVAGVGGFSINLGLIEIKGMSLGLIIGVLLNIMFKILAYFGALNEQLSYDEVVKLCKEKIENKDRFVITDKTAEFSNSSNEVVIIVERGQTNIYLNLNISQEKNEKWCMIYDDIIDIADNSPFIKLSIVSKMPIRHITAMIDDAIG